MPPQQGCHDGITTCSPEGSKNLADGLVTESGELGSAVFDTAREYRYHLTRHWDDIRPSLCWIMLNPSTANASKDDNTIRRVLGFSRTWGYGSIDVVNLFAWRATSQRELRNAADPVGAHNDRIVAEAVIRSSAVVAAWGNGGSMINPLTGVARCDEMKNLISDLGAGMECLEVTKLHQPRHPLYVSKATHATPMDA